MATLTQEFDRPSVLVRLIRGTAEFGAVFAAAREASIEYEQLSGLSDEALAARGLKREDLGRYIAARHLDV